VPHKPNYELDRIDERNRQIQETRDPVEWGRRMAERLREVASHIRDHDDEGIYIWRSDAESMARLIERLVERCESFTSKADGEAVKELRHIGQLLTDRLTRMIDEGPDALPRGWTPYDLAIVGKARRLIEETG
jgi:hypothetical protein